LLDVKNLLLLDHDAKRLRKNCDSDQIEQF